MLKAEKNWRTASRHPKRGAVRADKNVCVILINRNVLMLHLFFNHYSFLYRVNKQKQLDKSKFEVHFMLAFSGFVKQLYMDTTFNISELPPTTNQMDVL